MIAIEVSFQQPRKDGIAVKGKDNVTAACSNQALLFGILFHHVGNLCQGALGDNKAIGFVAVYSFLPNGKPEAINGDHMELLVLNLKQFPGKDRLCLIGRGGITGLCDHGL